MGLGSAWAMVGPSTHACRFDQVTSDQNQSCQPDQLRGKAVRQADEHPNTDRCQKDQEKLTLMVVHPSPDPGEGCSASSFGLNLSG